MTFTHKSYADLLNSKCIIILRSDVKHDNKGARGEKDKRFEVQYNPQLFAILAEKLLLSGGVDILYGTYAVGVNVSDSKIKHIITENKSGRVAYQVKSVVDATGDCDIANFASVPTENFRK